MGKTAKKSILASLTCALVLFATPVRGEEESVLKAGNKPGTFDFNGTKASSTTAQPAASSDAGNGSSLRLMGLWLVLFGAGAGTLILWYRKRNGMGIPGVKPTKKLQIVERIALGHRREVVLIRACDRLLVVASHADQTSLLSDLAADDVEAATPAAFDNVYNAQGMQAANERLLRAEAQMRSNVNTTVTANIQQKAKVNAPVPQPWPEMEKA